MKAGDEVCEGVGMFCLAKGELIVISQNFPKCGYCKVGKERWRKRAGVRK